MREVESWSPVCRPPAGLVRPVRLDPSGLAGPTRGQARSRRWRRTSRGFYVPRRADRTVPEQRVLESSMLLPGGGAVTGWAALRWHGAGYFDGLATDGRTELPVPLAVGPRAYVQGRPGIRVMRDRLAPDEVRTVRGLPCTTVERALFDEMRHSRTVREATVAVDMTTAAELTSISRMRTYCRLRRAWNGVPQVHAALDLASEDSRSPNETRLRLVWVLDAGLPPPLANAPVFDLSGRLLGTADLFDPESGVVGEYDGAAHRGARRHRKDVMREHRFRSAGLEYFKAVGADLRAIDVLVERMTTTRARARWLPAGQRAWTLTPPDGWYSSPIEGAPLDERLAYQEWLQESAGQL